MWRSAKGETASWVEFDLGTVQSVGSLCVFNYNDAWYTDRGVRKADISVWTQETGWKKVCDDQPLEQAEGSDDYDDPMFVKLDGVKAQKIRLDDFTSFGDAEYIGLSEVQFFASLGPWAVRPCPADKSGGVHFGELRLAWTAGDGAKAHSLYLGTRPDDLKLLGQIEQTDAKVSQLAADTKYFWRVDETGADGSVAPGKVWNFATGGFGGWWKLDETEGAKVADSSGYKRDATIHGAPAWQPAGGRVGGALQFDGVDDYVDTGWSDHLPAWTVAAWIKSPAAPARAAASGPVHREKNFQFSWNHGDPQCRGAAIVSAGGTWHSAPFGELKADTWYHLAATYDGENLKAYKDGVLITDNADPSGEADAESATLTFGRHATEPKAFFAGTVDDVCVFAYPLSADEVKSLHSGTEPVVIARRPASGPPTLTYPAVVAANLAGPAAPVQPQAQIQPVADSSTQSPPSAQPAAAEPQKGRGRNLLAVVVILVVVGLIAGVSLAGKQKTRVSE